MATYSFPPSESSTAELPASTHCIFSKTKKMFVRSSRFLCASAATGGAALHFGVRSAYLIPHREKARRGGEDSFFLHPAGLCAADGVGGWASSGVDPAIYTRTLVAGAHDALKAQPFLTTPQAILQRGVGAASTLQGSCTAVAALMDHSKRRMLTHLVGDCGLIYVRNGECVFRTEEQQQGFNCPYQLPSNRVSDGRGQIIDGVSHNDLVILGSDGLFDNVPTATIVDIVKRVFPELSSSSPAVAAADGSAADATAKKADALAAAIAHAALKNSRDRTFNSPFAINARKAGYRFAGGKEDDITVVVGVLTPTDVDVVPAFSAIHEIDFSTGESKKKL